MRAPTVVFAVGNPSRGDDAIGPLLCERLAAWLAEQNLTEQVELIEDFQLNIEHALDLIGRQQAVFVDAGENTPAPFTFERIRPAAIPSHSTHALPPQAVLQVYRQTEGSEPPPSFVLCVHGECFELGERLSPAAEACLAAGVVFLQGWLRERCLLPPITLSPGKAQ